MEAEVDLIVWRHAEAHDAAPGQDDLQRALTTRGAKQAERMGRWLDQRLPEGTRILCSPAVRTEQTVRALSRKYKLRDALAPGASVQDVLETANWPLARHPVLLVGHQPVLGAVLAHLLGCGQEPLALRKGAVWWLRQRVREDHPHIQVLAVMSPDWS